MADTNIATQTTSLVRSRFEQALARRDSFDSKILLLDTSGSMAETGDVPGERKIDSLRGVVAALRTQGLTFKQCVFNTTHMWSDLIPEPAGGTNLADALDFVATQRPKHVVVVCDGYPDGGEMGRAACITKARAMGTSGCKIDAYYVGPKGDGGAAEFMNQLAQAGGGQSGAVSFAELENKIAGALTAGGDATVADKPIAL